MYKKQMKFQKAVCLLVLVASVIVFLYALGIMTDLYDALYTTIGAPDKPDNTRRNPVAGAFIYYDMQGFNKTFLHLGIALILIVYIEGIHQLLGYLPVGKINLEELKDMVTNYVEMLM